MEVVDKFTSNICSKSPPKIIEFIATKANNTFIIMAVETESTKKSVDIKSDLFKMYIIWHI
jgi:hypothetical protein